LWAEGFSSSLDVLWPFGSLFCSFFYQKKKKKSAVFFQFLFIKILDPYTDLDTLELLDPDPYPDPDFNESGSLKKKWLLLLLKAGL
jgi:hypothetical protein